MDLEAHRTQLGAEVAHWRLAVESLADLDTVAPPTGWSSLETYLETGLRARMTAMVGELRGEADRLDQALRSGLDLAEVRTALLSLRSRYLRAETILDFYGDAIATRANPMMGELLRGYDVLAGDSMAASLEPVGLRPPPALVYVDKGLGAAILRAGVRLWNHAHPSPAAAIKLTRHNLLIPTSLLHETGHQVAHQTGWNTELAKALVDGLQRRSAPLAKVWANWAREIAADVHAFAQAGWVPVSALANVVDGPSRSVYFIRPGDPHPFPMVRVLFNVALCRSFYGPGPWDNLAETWLQRHVPDPRRTAGQITRLSLDAMDDIVRICARQPTQAFRGQPLTTIVDPMRVSPTALAELERDAGSTLLTSSYLRRRESLRILSLLAGRSIGQPASAAAHRFALQQWVTSLGVDAAAQPSIPINRAA